MGYIPLPYLDSDHDTEADRHNERIERARRLKKFKLDPKYPHNRSDGMTRRNNAGTHLQPKGK